MTTQHAPILVLRDGVPVALEEREEQLVIAVLDTLAELRTMKTFALELHGSTTEVQGFLRKKIGFWKV